MQYRNKTIFVDAVQWTGSNFKEMEEFITVEFGYQMRFDGEGVDLIISDSDGYMTVMPTDYIVKGVNGKFYPYKANLFEKIYDIS